ncbi:SAM-dependent methyltransferase [Rhodococcus sp. Leaf7]|uniref:class I SAM-dependent methyltransferase n=1 Tax=unclassified Rhodococcus (in: high G+C Gram-positive bacteria) TaxID=192944 RepID=UPI0006F25864|nr:MULTISPECIES: methyltransferase [unclassified Rhodococcus (in: high G+C Gram-positive bacteria)]KQU06558.1 SAM-dependent methyltransferase [Rhodococcus sp. Leaf7]KQU42076.1 SAM-dependent methyltransferase [Rhodococcus sp. Leaf247]
MQDLADVLDSLGRAPDVEAPNLTAVDASDRLVLSEAADALSAATPGAVVVIGDRYGALTLGAAAAHGLSGIRVHQDPLTSELALARNADALGMAAVYTNHALDRRLLDGASVVLMQLPRALAELTEIAEAIARWADPSVQVFSAGRLKHMSRSMNDVLAASFGTVTATRASQKSRGLVASDPTPAESFTYPVRTTVADLDMTVVAHGAVFSGDRLDIGTRFLCSFLDRTAPDARRIVDLGCGTGILAVLAARLRPDAEIVATDRSAAAVASALATAEASGVSLTVRRDDAMASEPAASADVVLCNPPFHENAAVHTGGAEKLFAAARRVLRPGGELWTVHNSHLRFTPMLGRMVGPTEVMGRNAKFTVTKSIR